MNQHALRTRDFLLHMLEAVNQIRHYMEGKSEVEFLADRLLQDAVIRNLEVLGEAANNVMKVFPGASAKLPNIPFTAIYAIRNRLSHGYFLIDTSRVWKIIDRDLPALHIELDSAIRDLEAAPGSS